MGQAIIIRGAREHNLKNIDVTIPKGKLVVITGVSGSGKSSLAFDTIYAEGQRRYIESLSSYARQFLGQMEKPDVDYIEGLSPAISIDQKGTRWNPRSIVATTTEIYDYLRLLFARIGKPHCPRCGREIARQTVQQIVDSISSLPPDKRIMLLSPLVRDRKGEHQAVFDELRKIGYSRVRVDGRIYHLDEEIVLDRNKKHTIEAVVDRLVVGECERSRIADSVETALKLSGGVVLVWVADGEEMLFSEHFACVYCGINLGEIAPRTFSFNSPYGACPKCSGLGIKLEIDPDLLIPDKSLSLSQDAIQSWVWKNSWASEGLEELAWRYHFSLDTPIKDLKPEHLNLVLYGEGGEWIKYRSRYGRIVERYTGFEGVIPYLERRYRESGSELIKADIERLLVSRTCPACNGKRLKSESLAVTINGKNIMDVTGMTVSDARKWVEELGEKLNEREKLIARQIIKELKARLCFLEDVGLEYITLDRASSTLSAGEAQRVKLATQIGSGLTGVLYICDEPTIGLHPADNYRLINILRRLKELGNTVIVVEHDEAMIRSADWIIDLGPGAGENGGWLVAEGGLEDIKRSPQSITGQYLKENKIATPKSRRPGNGKEIVILGASENNLKNIDVRITLGKLIAITGVSGSGKSTLVYEVLYKNLAKILYHSKESAGKCRAILGVENIDKVINIDQSPIGRTPRSNPATYTNTFTPIRELFARLPEARARGYTQSRFSFNLKGGRCEACKGEGFVQIEMQFLPDVTVPCEVCKGRRYNREALEVKFKGKSIADVLDMTVEEALEFFWNFPRIRKKLETLRDVGLGYIKLGQPATTLSGGEAQRVKLAAELSKKATGRTLYLLDEPTTGLSLYDISFLINVLHRLVDAGNTVIIIEHHLDIIKNADWVIDLGPGAGEKGGYIVAQGTPEQIAQNPSSITGKYLPQSTSP